jgi:hypothetical protein
MTMPSGFMVSAGSVPQNWNWHSFGRRKLFKLGRINLGLAISLLPRRGYHQLYVGMSFASPTAPMLGYANLPFKILRWNRVKAEEALCRFSYFGVARCCSYSEPRLADSYYPGLP